MEELVKRVKVRYLDGEAVPADDVIEEMLNTVSDRLKIQIDANELPALANSLVVEAAQKCLRLRGYEGSTSESASDGGSISNSFVDDVLAAYSDDISALRESVHRASLKFLR